MSEEPGERPSRSQLRREAEAVTALGAELVRLRPEALQHLPLDEDLVAAIETCRSLQKSARNRQVKRIGKLLRARDHEAIRAALRGARSR